MNHLVAPIVRPLLRWARESQRNACRNAMVASTALAERRHERRDVEEYLSLTLGERFRTHPPRHTSAEVPEQARVI
ncbi:MAG: hypothetical protein ABIN79_09620 [Marmoricola sp.]